MQLQVNWAMRLTYQKLQHLFLVDAVLVLLMCFQTTLGSRHLAFQAQALDLQMIHKVPPSLLIYRKMKVEQQNFQRMQLDAVKGIDVNVA